MSGHSKWSTIKRQKGAADAKRGQAFTKLANAITLAVRSGGGISDPESNFKLRLAIDKARMANMPKENIERAIDRGKGSAKDAFTEVLYEGFAPGGVALIVEAATDNSNRTTSEIKNIIEKNGGTLGTPGSVAYQFEQKGLVTVAKNGTSYDDIFLQAADAGAEDVEDATDSEAFIYTKPEDLKKVKDFLITLRLNVKDAELTRRPHHSALIQDQVAAQRVITLLEKLEEHDDVQKVYSNLEIPNI